MPAVVVHHTPGRIRWQIPRLRHDSNYGQTLENLILAIPVILGARINPGATSLVVSYHSPGLAKSEVETLIHTCITQAETTHPLPPPEPFPTPAPPAIRDWEAEVEAERPPESDWERLGWPLISLTLALLATPWELPPLVVGLTVLAGAWPWFQRTQTRWQREQAVSVDLLDTLWLGLHTLNGEFLAPALKTSLASGRADLRDRLHEFSPYPSLLLNPDRSFLALRQGIEQRLTETELAVGDCLWVEAGEIVPVDGQVVTGQANLGLVHGGRTLTTVSITPTDFVYAGSQVLSGRILVEAQRLGWQTRIGLVTEIRQAEPVYDSTLAKTQAQLAHQSVLPTLALSGCVLAATGNPSAALAPLQLDFGSGIQLSLRTVFLAALIAATQAGVYIPSAASLEKLASLRVLVIDQGELNLNLEELQALEALGHYWQLKLIFAQAGELEGIIQAMADPDAAILTRPGTPYHYPNTWLQIFWGSREIHPQRPEIVILEPSPEKLHWGLSIAHQALDRAYQNTALICLPNVMVVGAGMVSGLSPVINVMTNNTTAFLVEFLPQPRFLRPPALVPRASFTPKSTLPSPFLTTVEK